MTKEPQMDDYTEVLSARVLKYSQLVAKYRADLIGYLRAMSYNPKKITDQALVQKAKDAAFVLQGRVEALQLDLKDWEARISGNSTDLTRFMKDLDTVLDLGPQISEWETPKSKKLGNDKLGTSLKFEVLEITLRGNTWKVYVTESHNGTFRVAPQVPGEEGRWVVDRKGLTWESTSNGVHKSPKEAAKALEEMLSNG